MKDRKKERKKNNIEYSSGMQERMKETKRKNENNKESRLTNASFPHNMMGTDNLSSEREEKKKKTISRNTNATILYVVICQNCVQQNKAENNNQKSDNFLSFQNYLFVYWLF